MSYSDNYSIKCKCGKMFGSDFYFCPWCGKKIEGYVTRMESE